MKLFPLVLFGGLAALLASGGGSSKAATDGYVPDSVVKRVTAAVASGDPAKMRAEAAKLRAEGYTAQAASLEAAAVDQERLDKLPPVTFPTTPAKPPASKPPATKPPTTKPPATTKPPTVPPVIVRPPSSAVPVSAGVPKELAGQTLRKAQPPEPYDKRVELWQDRLKALGYRPASSVSDGKFGPNTEAQTKALQTAKGLTPDGVVGPRTLNAAFGSTPAPATTPAPQQTTPQLITPLDIDVASWRPIMKYGQSGRDVLEWQTVLIRDGLPLPSGADSFFGKETESSTKGWQTSHGLQPDGIVGKDVRGKLTGALPPKASASAVAFLMPGVEVHGLELEDEEQLSPSALPATSSTVELEQSDLKRLAHELAEHLQRAEDEPDRFRVELFQRSLGLNATGVYGPATAEAIAAFGVVPPLPREWPTKKLWRAKTRYRAAMLSHAQADPSRAAEWLRAATV